MNFKSIMCKIIIPRLRLFGFELIWNTTKCCEFKNNINGLQISFTILPHGAASIAGDLFDMLKADPTKRFSVLSVLYSIQQDDGLYLNIASDQFESTLGIMGDFLYCSPQELEDKVVLLMDNMEKKAIPFLMSLSRRLILPFVTAYENLARNPQEQAAYAQQKYNLCSTYTSCIGIEAALIMLRGDSTTDWKKSFVNNLNDIVSLAAYVGEVIIQRGKCGNWCWQATSPIDTKLKTYPGGKYFIVTAEYNQKSQTCNPFKLICSFWNFYPLIKCFHVDSIDTHNRDIMTSIFRIF